MDGQLFKLVSERGSSGRDIRMLIDNGARVDSVDHAVASAHGCIKIGCLLLDHGAWIYAKDKKGNTPIDIANPTGVASALLAHKKELDKLLKENAQLIAVLGSKYRKKFEMLLRDEHEQLIEHVRQEKKTILATQATSVESVQCTLETLHQRMNHFEQQLQQYQQNHDNVDYAADHQDNNECIFKSRVSSQYQPGEEPPMKRQRQEFLVQDADDYTPSAGAEEKDDSLRLQVAHFEKQLEEQHAEIAALREMVMSGNDLLTPTTDEVVSTSCTTGGLSKVKMEAEAVGDNDNDGDMSAAANDQQEVELDSRDIVIADLEQKVQHLQAELEASQEMAHLYKMERDEYKKKMDQLHQLTG